LEWLSSGFASSKFLRYTVQAWVGSWVYSSPWLGRVTVLFSTVYYFLIRHDIDNDTYEPSTRRVVVFSIIITLLAVGVIYYVFTTALDPMNGFVPE
jgi:hypothetical protein